MDYPKTNLNRRVRIIIMSFFIFSFFVISPIVISYTVGYRYDWKKREIKQTGVINIDIKPKDSSIYLNNIKINQTIPIKLNNRAPGIYNVKIQREGYHDWIKDVNIESKKTTYIKDITLFKQSLPIKILEDIDPSNIQNIYPNRNGVYIIILTKKDSIFELFLYNTNNKKINQIIREEVMTDNLEVNWSQYSDFAMIKTIKKNKINIEIFNPNNPELSENYSFNKDINSYQWSNNQHSGILFVNQNNKIIKLNNKNKNNLATTTSSVWYVDNQENIWILENKKLIKNNLDFFHLSEPNIQKIIYLKNKFILMKKEEKVLAGTLKDSNVIINYEINIDNLIPYSDNNGWFAWTPWEMWSLKENGEYELYTRTSEVIKNILSTENNDTTLILYNNRLVGFNSRYFTNHELLKNIEIYSIGNNIKNRKIYFFGKIANILGIFEMEY